MTKICAGHVSRPGGFEITNRAIAFCGFPKNAKLADIGCGLGGTVRYLRQNYGYAVWGIEKDEETVKLAGNELIRPGDGADLPFGAAEMDGLLFECSLSKMAEPQLVLAECSRVLKPWGYLIISDLYASGKSATLSGLLGRVEPKEELLYKLRINGFTPILFEDYSDALRAMWGQLVLEYGTEALGENLGVSQEDLCAIKCGYCLIIALKRGEF